MPRPIKGTPEYEVWNKARSAKISASKKGNVPGDKISASKKGHITPQATRDKISATLQGHQLTPEQHEHHLAAMQEFVENLTPEQRYEMGKGNRGKHFTEEHCTRIGTANKGRTPPTKGKVYSEEEIAIKYATRIGVPSPNKGRPMPKHVKEMLYSPEIKAKRAASYSANYAAMSSEKQIERILPWMKAGRSGKGSDTTIERFVASQLDAQGIVYEQQKRIGRYFVDFYLPEQNTIIEVNGCWWHGCLVCGFDREMHQAFREKDEKRTAYLEAKGYTVKIIWEHEIRPLMEDTRSG